MRVALLGPLVLLRQHGELLWEITKRNFSERYARHWLGTLWVIVHPLFIMGLYLTVFAVIIRPHIGGTIAPAGDYALFLLAGLVPWMTFHESMSKSCGAILAQAVLVKQVVFPLHILPVAAVLATSANQFISLAALALYAGLNADAIPASWLLLPFLMLVQLLAMIGTGFMLSAVSVYLRDLKEVVQVFGMVGVYLMPVFYPVEWAPGWGRSILQLNPFTYMTWCYQDALYAGRIEHPAAWLLFPVLSVGTLVLGWRIFARLKPYFGSVL